MDQERDIRRATMRAVRDTLAAIGLLTRLPVPARFGNGARAAWAWPLAGVAVAALAALLGKIADLLGLGTGVIAGVILGAEIMITGAMHEDGLADSADGLWGGWDKDRRLAIMTDSHIGSYGVLALGLALILRWTCLSALVASGGILWCLIAAAVLSRAPMVAIMALMPNARGAGLSQSVGRPTRMAALIAALIAFGVAVLAVGTAATGAALAAALAAGGVALIARAKIGGQTGDICGASQQAALVASLAVLAV